MWWTSQMLMGMAPWWRRSSHLSWPQWPLRCSHLFLPKTTQQVNNQYCDAKYEQSKHALGNARKIIRNRFREPTEISTTACWRRQTSQHGIQAGGTSTAAHVCLLSPERQWQNCHWGWLAHNRPACACHCPYSMLAAPSQSPMGAPGIKCDMNE